AVSGSPCGSLRCHPHCACHRYPYWTLAKREEKQSTMSIFCPMERGRRTRRREPRVVALNNRPIEPEPPPELKARGFPFQQELAAQRLQDPLDAHPVFDDAIQHQIPDLVVVMGFGEHTLGSVSERRAALAPGCVLAVGDLQVGHRLEGDRAYLTGTCPFSFAQFATLGTRGLLGSAMNRYKDNRGSIRAHACVRSEEGPEEPHSEGRKP